jgi:hypothetical protein
MRKLTAGMVVGLVAVLAAAPAVASRRCAPSGAKTLARSTAWRVFAEPPGQVLVRACRLRDGVTRFVGYYNEVDRETSQYRLRGNVVAYALRNLEPCDGRYETTATCGAHVATTNLVTGLRKVSVELPGIADDLALGPERHWAIILRNPKSLSVLKQDRDGLVKLSDDAGILSGSLGVSGTKVTWREGAVVRSAELR